MTGTITLVFDWMKAVNGVMECWLVMPGQRRSLEVFSPFSPFYDLLTFTRFLVTNALPYDFIWGEDGSIVELRALPAGSGGDLFRLQIVRDEEEVLVDAEFDRLKTANGVLESLRSFALDCPEAGTDWQFPYFLIENFERARANGFAPNPEPDPVEDANFVFEHFDASGKWTFLPIETSSAKKLNPSFYLWIGDRLVLYLRMDEGPRLWRVWFDLLEKIERAELPADVIIDSRKSREECDNDLDFTMQQVHAHSLRAEPVPHPDQFRFISRRISEEFEDENQSLAGVRLDRKQFTGAFMKAFDEFLQTDYLAYRTGNPGGFDLRGLRNGR